MVARAVAVRPRGCCCRRPFARRPFARRPFVRSGFAHRIRESTNTVTEWVTTLGETKKPEEPKETQVSKEFMEAGKRRLAGDTARAATTDEVKDLRREARDLKECVADLTLENRLLKKSMTGNGGYEE